MDYESPTVWGMVRDVVGLWFVNWGLSMMTRGQFKQVIDGIVEEFSGRKNNNG